MSKMFRTPQGSGSIARLWIFVLVCSIAAGPAGKATPSQAARVTVVIKDVRLLSSGAAAKPAALNDNVLDGTAVRTGTDSRAELTFADLTITRLGANTVFSFNEGTRNLDLGSGAVLVQVPKGGAALHVSTAAVTAAITGGTALFESHTGAVTKLLVMEGTGRLCSKRYPDECATARGGEMTMMSPDGHIIKPVKFNAALVLKTSKLIKGFPPLANQDLISSVIEEQQAEQSGASSGSPSSANSNYPIDVISTSVTAMGGTSSTSGPKFGPPSAIKSPNPYVITSGTAINTDPMITTNGITNFGKIYRGVAIDGPLPTWLGSSPSAFDMIDFFDCTSNCGGFANPGKEVLPAAGFLFSGLQLVGDPTVSNSSNYPLLAFVSQTGITSAGAPGTIFSFGGVNQVGLVTLNGSIDLSGIGFANFGALFVYARGGGSNLTFDATTQNLQKVELRAEGDLEVDAPVTVSTTAANHKGFKALAGNNLTINSVVTDSTGGGIKLQSLGGITLTSSSQLLSMLGSMGESGQVLIVCQGSDTPVSVSGTVTADQGEVDIRQTGVAGSVALNNATIHGDVVKISALGASGTLNINSGNTVNADTIIKLYAPGSNGVLNFNSSATLNGPSVILAANTINIAPGALVTVNMPGGAPATVYVTPGNANYFGFGGDAASPGTAGTFGGAGASSPKPLNQAPALGGPGQGP